LVHLSILLGIVSTIGYWFMFDQKSAVVVSIAVGFTYVTANMIQMDLAAQICPPGVSATVFSTLMAVTNFGLSLSYAVGGYLYDWGSLQWDPHFAFRMLVGVGAITTAACWLFVPRLIPKS
jgi:MFS family permease